jgi:hypothetical protein
MKLGDQPTILIATTKKRGHWGQALHFTSPSTISPLGSLLPVLQ